MLAAAKQAGLPGADGVPTDPAAPPAGPPPEPELVAAEDALSREDYAAALAAYDSLLARKPADAEAVAGKAWASLLMRTADVTDPSAVLAAAAAAPDDVAATTAFLASTASRYITGQVIGVNGGMYM